MNKIFKKWDPISKFFKGDVVLFGGKLYLANNDNSGILPIHRKVIKNVFQTIDNSELVNQLIKEYNCEKDHPITSNITFDKIPINFIEDSGESTPITFTDENIFNWELI